MTRKHHLYFIIWKIKMFFKGYRKGTAVFVWSEDKEKFIRGYVRSLLGDSVNHSYFDFTVWIDFIEPIQGNNSNFYNCGFYNEKQLVEQKVKII